ncbi:MAG: ABC transporter permease [Betaproteobacteria bacterium]|nr:MAG: ABC transporter permease [Betaproteobacteria bacterium]
MSWIFAHFDALRDSMRRLLQQPFATALNVAVFGIALALPCGFYIALDNVARFSRELTSEPQLSLFLTVNADASDVKAVEQRLTRHPAVLEFRFVDRSTALKDLKRASGMSDVLSELESNPLPHAFVVAGRSADPDLLEALRDEASRWPKVEHVQLDSEWARKLDAALKIGRMLVTLLGVLLSFALVAVTFNTIRLQILTRHDEIEVSKLIGATNHFIRRPFLYLGGLQGLLGGFGAWLIVAIAVRMLNHELASFGGLFGMSPSLGHMTLQQITVLMALAALIGWLGAWMSVSRHLWHMDPR